MIDPKMSERLRTQVFSTVLKGFYLRDLATRLRQGELVTFYLPHSSGPDDRVEIGGAFFSASEDPIRDVGNILADLMAIARPFCQGWIFELNIQSPEHVKWRMSDWSDKVEIQGGPEPLDQALARMFRLGREEEQLKSMLDFIGALEEELPDWEVSLLRSCCMSLRKKLEGHLFYAIDLSMAAKLTVLAFTSIRKSDDVLVEKGKSMATYLEHILPFALEIARRISELAAPLSKVVTTQWGQVPVVIAPPDCSPDRFLPERHRLLEI